MPRPVYESREEAASWLRQNFGQMLVDSDELPPGGMGMVVKNQQQAITFLVKLVLELLERDSSGVDGRGDGPRAGQDRRGV